MYDGGGVFGEGDSVIRLYSYTVRRLYGDSVMWGLNCMPMTEDKKIFTNLSLRSG